MPIHLAPFSPADREAVIDIFNYYIVHSMAAFIETPLPYDFYDTLLVMGAGYPNVVARNDAGEVLGFGMLRPYHHLPAFARTAEISYFLAPAHTGQGTGRVLLAYLLDGARAKGLATVLACISSHNAPSLRFHAKHGFSECGRFREVGRKHDTLFDLVWMQKDV